MKRIHRIMAVVCMAALLLTTGCGKKHNDTGVLPEEHTVVFRYGDMAVTKGEVYIYVNTVKERYEKQYGKDVWNRMLEEEEEEVTAEELVRKKVVEEIVHVKTMNAHADEYGIRLTSAEQEDINTRAQDFYDGLTEEDRQQMELSLEKILQVYRENVIATKVEDALLSDQPVEISSEEARMTTFYDLYFPCYNIDENGNVTPYEDDAKRIQYDHALEACSTLSNNQYDAEEDADMPKNAEEIAQYYQLTDAGKKTMTPEEIRDTYGQDVYDLLYTMENGSYSKVIETEYGYHVFVMIELTDQKATEARKTEMRQAAVEESVGEILDLWKQGIDEKFTYPDSVNMEIYRSIPIR